MSGYLCPSCGEALPDNTPCHCGSDMEDEYEGSRNKNAGKLVRQRVGDRDGWICHRCGMAINQSLNWPHPLAPVADHYPVSRRDGGRAVMANLRIAHSLCNGSSYFSADEIPDDTPASHREIMVTILALPYDSSGSGRSRMRSS